MKYQNPQSWFTTVKPKNLMSTSQDQETKSKKTAPETTSSDEMTEEVVNPSEEDSGNQDDLLLEQQERISRLEDELERVKDTQLRKAAEMENFRKRLQRERDQMYQISRESAVEAFLPVYDDLLRTLEALKKADAEKAYLDGVQLVVNKFDEVLNHYNVEKIDKTGVPFDVNLHDALMRQKPDDDDIESGTVLQVFENGYRIGDKTLRHAKVIVSE
jgi:molecular chaperone GrpE